MTGQLPIQSDDWRRRFSVSGVVKVVGILGTDEVGLLCEAVCYYEEIVAGGCSRRNRARGSAFVALPPAGKSGRRLIASGLPDLLPGLSLIIYC